MGSGPSSYASARASTGINSSRGTFAMAASTRLSWMPRPFNCWSTIRWRCAAKSAIVRAPWPQPVVAIAAKSKHCATIRIRRTVTTPARLRKSRCLSFETRLSHRHHGVHVTQAISKRFHHMRRKMRRLLNEKVKPAAVDLRQFGGSLRHGIRRPWTVVNQRHLTNERARSSSFQHEIAEENVDLPFQQNVHLVAFLALPE